MKRYISKEDNEYYTYMLEILNAIGGRNLNYNWLITDIEAYPSRKSVVDKISGEYLLLSNNELLDLLEKEDFQWIWGIFSAIPPIYSQKKILKYQLPSVTNLNNAGIQHPLAKIEIVAFDSSYVQITCIDEKIADMFWKKYKLSKQ